MLPGFRFLFAAIVLSMSVLVFGLGAAALLRAAHEEFASTPSWRAASEPKFAQQNEAPREAPGPMLAMLRLEPVAAEQKASDSIPATAAPAIAPVLDEPEKVAALKPRDTTPPEAATPEIPLPEISMQSEATPADAPAPAGEAKIAATEVVQAPVNQAAPPASGQASAPALPDSGTAATKVAALGDQAASLEAQPPAKAVAKPDRSVIRKRLRARRAAQRRRLAERARLAQQAASQQQTNPFAQLAITARSR